MLEPEGIKFIRQYSYIVHEREKTYIIFIIKSYTEYKCSVIKEKRIFREK